MTHSLVSTSFQAQILPPNTNTAHHYQLTRTTASVHCNRSAPTISVKNIRNRVVQSCCALINLLTFPSNYRNTSHACAKNSITPFTVPTQNLWTNTEYWDMLNYNMAMVVRYKTSSFEHSPSERNKFLALQKSFIIAPLNTQTQILLL